jgi:tol-pal system-associated acyl-CoA thioesterase
VEHRFAVEVYYEDTDFSGLVYHANYLKYFERAREHLLGRERLVRLFRDEGMGFVVYRADLEFKEGAVFGDTLEIRTRVTLPSDFRALFHQEVWRPGGTGPAVKGELHLVCILNAERRLVRLPASVIDAVAAERTP